MKARISRITAARLFNTGNYEHVRFELTVEVPDGSDPAEAFASVTEILNGLRPVTPHSRSVYERAKAELARPASELQLWQLQNIPEHKATVESFEKAEADRASIMAKFSALGGSTQHGGGYMEDEG